MSEMPLCPICGSKFEIVESARGYRYTHKNADCPINAFAEVGDSWFREEELITALNTRPLEAALQARVDGLTLMVTFAKTVYDKMMDYRRRNTLNFQLEKMDDYLRMLGQVLEEASHD